VVFSIALALAYVYNDCTYEGDAEMARTDITRPDNAAPDSKGGHRETGK